MLHLHAWELLLAEQEKLQKEQQSSWDEATELMQEARQARLKAKRAALEEEQKDADQQAATVKALRNDAKARTAGRDVQVAKNKLLDADKKRLEKEVKELMAQLDRMGRQDSAIDHEPEEPSAEDKKLEQDIMEWEKRVAKAKEDVTECEDLVTRESTTKVTRQNSGKPYNGSLGEYESDLAAARELLQKHEGNVERLNKNGDSDAKPSHKDTTIVIRDGGSDIPINLTYKGFGIWEGSNYRVGAAISESVAKDMVFRRQSLQLMRKRGCMYSVDLSPMKRKRNDKQGSSSF